VTALDQLPTALRAWGLDVVEVTGWQTRRRPGTFAPLGVLIHHTAGPRGKDAPSLQVCIDGRRDLAGPLCQILVARSGKVYVISVGRCNHAGIGGPLAGMVPVDAGNRLLVGIEAENDGVGEPWPVAQQLVMVRASAAVLDLLGRARGNCWAHREYTPRKIDPKGLDMDAFRWAVAHARTPGEPTMPTPPKPPTSLVEQWQRALLANGAPLGDAGPDRNGADGDFGRLTLDASVKILDHRNQLLAEVKELPDLRKANAISSATIVRLTEARDKAAAEIDRLLGKATAREAEIDRLTGELEQARKANGTAALAQLIATVEASSDRLTGAVAEARKGLA